MATIFYTQIFEIFENYEKVIEIFQTWQLRPRNGGQIKLTFTHFQIESHSSCAWDYVEIAYGPSFVQKYCGDSSIPGPFITSTTITVRFRTDGSDTRSGFRASWIEIGGANGGAGATIQSQNYPSNYPNSHTKVCIYA